MADTRDPGMDSPPAQGGAQLPAAYTPPAASTLLPLDSEHNVASGPTAVAIKRTVFRLLVGRDLHTLSFKMLRKEVEGCLDVPEGSLEAHRDEVQAAARAFLDQRARPNVS